MRKSLIESGLAIGAAAAIVVMMAAPASATPTSGEVTGGSLVSAITNPPLEYDLGVGADLCMDGDTTITVDVTGSAPNYDSEVTAANLPRGFFDIGSDWYRLELSLDTGGDNTGVVTTSGTVPFQSLALTGTITEVSAEGQCTGGTQVCDLGGVEVIASGTHTSSGSLPSLNGTAILDGSADFPDIGVCSAPFSALEDVGASVDDLTIVFPA